MRARMKEGVVEEMGGYSGNDWNGDGSNDFLDDLFDFELMDSGLKDRGSGGRRKRGGGGCGCGFWLFVILIIVLISLGGC